MGEYLTLKVGNKVEEVMKAGVGGDWRYVRHEEIVAWQHYDHRSNTDPAWALDPLNRVLFRFPWPWEDGQVLRGGRPYWEDANELRNIEQTRMVYAEREIKVEHLEIVQHIKPYEAGSGVNVWIPCPIGDKKNLLKHSPTEYFAYNVVGERINPYTPNELYTTFACAWCGALFSITKPADLAMLVNSLEKDKNGRNSADIATRLKLRKI